MTRPPSGFCRFLCALDFHLGPRVEIALIGSEDNGLGQLVAEGFGRFLPNRVGAGLQTATVGAAAGIPSLESRGTIEGRATAYVSRNYSCELPVTDRAALAR